KRTAIKPVASRRKPQANALISIDQQLRLGSWSSSTKISDADNRELKTLGAVDRQQLHRTVRRTLIPRKLSCANAIIQAYRRKFTQITQKTTQLSCGLLLKAVCNIKQPANR